MGISIIIIIFFQETKLSLPDREWKYYITNRTTKQTNGKFKTKVKKIIKWQSK